MVEKILRGERRAFEEFYRKEKKKLEYFVLGKVGNRADAEEIVQDSFLGFLDSLPLFSFRSSLKTFLYSVARHEVADYFRRKYAKKALKYVPIVGELVSRELNTTWELSEKIDRVYGEMVPRMAKVLQMKYEEGLSVKEIARNLKISVKAAESKLFRARKEFQLAFEEE